MHTYFKIACWFPLSILPSFQISLFQEEFISVLGILPLPRRCYLTPRCQSLDLCLINKDSMGSQSSLMKTNMPFCIEKI